MFKKATKQVVKLKLAITGPSGAGKTMSALRIARGIVGEQGRIAYLDTENGSAALYSDQFDFDVCPIRPPFADHSKFIAPVQDAVDEGYDLIVIDSASHFWEGILEYKDQLDRRGGNSFANWATAGGHFKEILATLLQSDIHVIVCLRSKIEHVMEKDDKGKTSIRKVGLAPIMREGIEYEFTTVFDLDIKHQAQASKDRTGLFRDNFFLITEATGKTLVDWMRDGVVHKPPISEAVAEPVAAETVAKIKQAWAVLKKTEESLPQALAFAGNPEAAGFGELDPHQAEKLLKELQGQMNRWAEKNKVPEKPSGFQKDDGPKGAALQKEADALDAVPFDFANDLKALFEPHESVVNAYLIGIGWLSSGKTWRDLSSDKVQKIKARQESFCRAANIKDGVVL